MPGVTGSSPVSSTISSRVRLLIVIILVSAGVTLAAVVLVWDVPSELRALEVHETLEPARVIVILNGENNRADEAATLFRGGYGREIWLTDDPRTGSTSSVDAGTTENLRRLAAGGVPADAIRHLPRAAATSTKAELEQIGAQLRRHGVDRAIVVTSKLHGRRVRLLWRCTGDHHARVIVHAPERSHYVGARVVGRELLGLAGAWLCLG